MKRFKPRSVIANLTRVAAISFLRFFVACSDDDSDSFLVKGDDTSYSSEDDEPESSSARSSSSSGRSSSSSSDWLDSVEEVAPCRTEETDSCKYGELVDSRDGQTYRTVVIGNQTWMAENLNFKSDSCQCFNNQSGYCDKYGQLYTWAEAMEICPAGWHLPSLNEWKTLYIAAGGLETSASRLRADYDWESRSMGTDEFGFTVLPGGAYLAEDYREFRYGGTKAIFWTSTKESNTSNGVRMHDICFDERGGIVDGNGSVNGNTFSVRCIKD